ncbi:MAG: UvrB/UvrC motif-containing protein [candidate division FCPU426 bacterium]
MLCQICQQEEATVHLIDNIGNQQSSLHICENCAQKRHLGEMLVKPALIIHNLLASLLELGAASQAAQADVKCGHCGLHFSQFREVGRFGCEHCYDAFRPLLLPLFRQFHQAEEHKDRVRPPAPVAATKPKLEELKEQLRHLIESEKFEEAAQLRDKIHSLEGRQTA